MDLDNLLRIAFFIIIFVVPILSSLSKKGKKKGQTIQRPVQKPVQVPSQPLNTHTVSGKQHVESDFERRLAEARKRVQESIEKQEAAQKAPSTAYQAPSPVLKPVAAFPPVSSYNQPDRPKMPPPRVSLETVIPLGGSLESKANESQQLKVSKLKKTKKSLVEIPVVKSKALPIGFGSKDIMAGIIWKQILDKPKFRRRK